MKKTNYLKFIVFIFYSLFSVLRVESTHIRAGEITAARISDNTFALTLTLYGNLSAPYRSDDALFDFGDGTTLLVNYNNSEVGLNAATYSRTYKCTKTYSGTGNFLVSTVENFRNAGIRNISNSVNTPFYIQTYISVSSFTGSNNPVKLTIPPIDFAAVGKLFVHNPGAIDADGDSLSYKLITPRQAAGVEVNGYTTPDYSASFSIDAVKGDLIWDRPLYLGLYNVAFIIEEWRKTEDGTYIRVGFVTRDMQIEVVNSDNNPPIVFIPNDTCIVAGTLLTKVIRATDPDGNLIKLTASPSTYFTVPFTPQPPVAVGNFNWQTNCSTVRNQPYRFVFEAEDVGPATPLTDYKTWSVTVKGPAPNGLTITVLGTNSLLSWNSYTCTNAEKMEIYRKSCGVNGLLQTPCASVVDNFPGYIKIGEVPIGATFFLDDNKGVGLAKGVNHCYILIAKFQLPGAGESYGSAERCASVKLDVPLITNVSIQTTSETSGTITIDWLAPLEASFVGPYTYNLYRAVGSKGTVFSLVAPLAVAPFVDNGLNTMDSTYHYKIELVGGGNSDPAPSIFLKTSSGNSSVELEWDSTVFWLKDSMYIYRSLNGSAYSLLTRVIGNSISSYNDDLGLKNCDTVCYYLKGFSSYCNPLLPAVVYENFSEISCNYPTDGKLPNTPILSVKGCGGNIDIFYDLLDWNDVSDPLCNNIESYNVYYGDYEDTDLSLVATTKNTITDYVYTDTLSTAGCFAVAAVNRLGIEGAKSEKVCVDDCVFYELPNLITPNNDLLNDVFKPFPIPRGVKVVTFSVYNRWGALVYSIDNNIFLNWNGKSFGQEALSDGIYYFSAEVKYYRRQKKSDESRLIKGWVQIIDQEHSNTNE